MSKKKIISGILVGLSIFLFFSNINVAAAPPTWIGVSEGDSYSWGITINIENFVKFAEDLGMESQIAEIETGLASFGGEAPSISLGITIDTISDLIVGLNYSYVEVNCTPSVTMMGVDPFQGQSIDMSLRLIDPTEVNWTVKTFTYLFNAFDSMEESTTIPFALLIVPTTVNWTGEAQSLTNLLELMGISAGNLTISTIEDGNGLEVTIKALAYSTNQTKDITFKLSYNDNGVLGQLDMLYGLESVLTIGPPPPDTIPGFEIPLIIGVSSIATIGVIFFIKKKKVNIKN